MHSPKVLRANLFKAILLAAVLYGLYTSFFQPEYDFYDLPPLAYFTIQSNILVALHLVYTMISPRHNRFRTITRGVVLLSISITGLVFHIILAPEINLFTGENISFAQHLTHTVAPIGFIIDWLLFDIKNQMRWEDLRLWVIHPLIYWLAFIIYGNFTGIYPYPFMDINLIGFTTAIVWLSVLTISFILLGLLYITIDIRLGKLNSSSKLVP